ncbi:MAG: hypothetical protein OP8BY_1247 [Candidatus Saccharicenans subterraneus]|uniref:Uncharacterized protein n=1 Tax=Candidatus Saccharicenans subterraneus TaxID=2508984 RepID=A0A3E2BPJ8_9BACT|nr:MAG: hypothetical protein OP8BY_1247 [Candidatus Saccharicenans subterraneum]
MKFLRYSVLLAILLAVMVSFLAGARTVQSATGQEQDEGLVPVKQLEVLAVLGWVDTGLDVKEGERFVFRVTGSISLQKGNPIASCGPEGLDLQTPQQPLPDRNLGAAVGRVVKVLSVTKDEETGEEIREEVSNVFYIGLVAEVEMPLEGRLYLGVNDNVFADNDGQFTVSIFRKKKE